MIHLIWPPRCLHPNARSHWAVKAKATKSYREYACLMASTSGMKITGSGKIDVYIEFLPPDKRRRDLDGCLSNIKAALDGIADGLGVDDYRFRLHLDIGDPLKGGGIKIELKEII